jgi:hypothetical protein
LSNREGFFDSRNNFLQKFNFCFWTWFTKG